MHAGHARTYLHYHAPCLIQRAPSARELNPLRSEPVREEKARAQGHNGKRVEQEALQCTYPVADLRLRGENVSTTLRNPAPCVLTGHGSGASSCS